jgi:hypothetical protein
VGEGHRQRGLQLADCVAAGAQTRLALGELVGGVEELRAVCAAALEAIGHASESGVHAVDLGQRRVRQEGVRERDREREMSGLRCTSFCS